MKTFYSSLEHSAGSLALNSDFSQVVIVGSHIFKIFSIEENGFVEKANLFKNQNNYPSTDVVWNPNEECMLATVATNGAVVTWNLNKPVRAKLDLIFRDNEHPVYRVNFHPSSASVLFSGDLHGDIKMYDLRIPAPENATIFAQTNESIRDIQFNTHNHNQFASGTGNGCVQLWDVRKRGHYECVFTGHKDPIFALDWHPDNKYWIATASRDNTIKVWDLQSETPVAFKTIRTVASVAKVKWRPNERYHLASVAVTHGSISVWDIRRPYVPFASFNEHRNLTSAIAWRGNPDNLLSVGKDNTLYCHAFSDAVHPIEKANPIGLCVSPLGLLSSTQPKEELSYISNPKRIRNYKDSITRNEPVSSVTGIYNLVDDQLLGSNYISECAKNYKLSGKNLADVCEHNANVAKKVNRTMNAYTWKLIQILYGGISDNKVFQGLQLKEDTKSEFSFDNEQKSIRHVSGDQTEGTTGTKGGGSAEEGDTETDDTDNPEFKFLNLASHNMFFGEGEFNSLPFDYDNLHPPDEQQDWIPPNEAFQPRKDVIYQSSTPPHDDFASIGENTLSTKESDSHPSQDEIENSGPDYVIFSSSILLNEVEPLSPSPMNYDELVKETLCHYADMGDIQMAVTLLIVLSDKVKDLIDEYTKEHWFLSYIEILHKLKLWNTATQVIQNAEGLPRIQNMHQNSTSVRLCCGYCDSSITFRRGTCKECRRAPSRCAVCHSVVNGMFVWCQGCAHGGHLLHLMEWLSKNPYCPTGCGHLCEYT